MVFSSTIYLFVFLPVVLIVYYNPVIKGRTFKNIFLLFASLVFYAWGEPAFVFLMLLSILVTWFAGLKLQKNIFKNNINKCYFLSYNYIVYIQVFNVYSKSNWFVNQ